jgi:hypothetical protein
MLDQERRSEPLNGGADPLAMGCRLGSVQGAQGRE